MPQPNRPTAKPQAFYQALCFLLLCARRPSALIHPQLWAEDGTVFYRDQLLLGPSAILKPHAGYLHLCSRLLAALAGPLSARWTPLFYSAAALAVAAFCASEFARPKYRTLLANDSLRAVLCLAMAAAFPAYELVGNLTNLQWFLLVAAIPFVLAPEPSAKVLAFFSGLALALSAPGLLILLPLLLWRAPSQRPSTLSGGLAVGLLAQVAVFFQIARPAPAFRSVAQSTLVALSNQVILPSLLGQRHAYSLVTKGPAFAGLVALAAFAAFVIVLGAALSRPERWKLAAAVWLMVGSLALSMAARPSVRELLQSFQHAIRFGADRYFFCACCLFGYCLALAAERLARASPPLGGDPFCPGFPAQRHRQLSHRLNEGFALAELRSTNRSLVAL